MLVLRQGDTNMNILQVFAAALLLALPMWLANMAAVVVARLGVWQVPVDRGACHKSDGRRLFGATKSLGGLIIAPLIATGLVLGIIYLFQLEKALKVSVFAEAFYDRAVLCWLLGDLVKSYYKRRMNIPSGTPWRPWDRIDMMLGSLSLALPFVAISLTAGARHWANLAMALPGVILLIPPLTMYGTDLVCKIGFALKIKREAW
jgi:CDP-2,3-bis-(O-geranylgeranyl)-sn-glycerol synthase